MNRTLEMDLYLCSGVKDWIESQKKNQLDLLWFVVVSFLYSDCTFDKTVSVIHSVHILLARIEWIFLVSSIY